MQKLKQNSIGEYIMGERISERKAAEYLKISRITLRKWRVNKEKKSPPYYVLANRFIQYDTAELDQWLESCRVDPGR